MAHTFPHIPLAASSAFSGKSQQGLYGDVIEEIDWSVGQMMQSLKENGIDNNTLVMFTSDNGPWFMGSPGQLRGRKGWSYEGGVREPFIARFPGRIPAASVLRAHVPGPAEQVGRDHTGHPAHHRGSVRRAAAGRAHGWREHLAGALRATTGRTPRHFLYFDSWNMQCARMGEWKLHVSRYNDFAFNPDPPGGRINLPLPTPELYNLELDPDESYDVAAAESANRGPDPSRHKEAACLLFRRR